MINFILCFNNKIEINFQLKVKFQLSVKKVLLLWRVYLDWQLKLRGERLNSMFQEFIGMCWREVKLVFKKKAYLRKTLFERKENEWWTTKRLQLKTKFILYFSGLKPRFRNFFLNQYQLQGKSKRRIIFDKIFNRGKLHPITTNRNYSWINQEFYKLFKIDFNLWT